jgi:ABC-2 type transport system ATP-binding protein
VIKTYELAKRFGDFTAVNRINLHVSKGEVLVLLGPNGAGKTTTVRLLTSILKPTSGSAYVAGYDVVSEASKVRSSVGVLTEHHGLYKRMNALEYLQFFGELYGLSESVINRRSTELLEQFDLLQVRLQKLGEYSKGMRQKLALTRALLHDPDVLLLDEPTSAMDPESARVVRNSIAGLQNKDRVIMICTHNLAEAEELADQIAIIRRGKIIQYDKLDRLKRTLLGPSEFEATFQQQVDGWKRELPDGIIMRHREHNRIRFQIANPELQNPVLLRILLDSGLEVISFQIVVRSLEQAYLTAVRAAAKEDGGD